MPLYPDPLPPVETVLPDMVQRIVAAHHPSAVILFGSRARGTAGPDSDTDLLIVLERAPHKLAAAISIRETLSYYAGYPKDIIVATPAQIAEHKNDPTCVISHALKEGIVLYDRASQDARNA
jgi:predicted nucleotidyltransferase